MHLLPCPHCQHTIEVAPSQAGGQMTCPQCQRPIEIPTLGRLRQLPASGSRPTEVSPSPVAESAGPSGRRLGFVAMGVIATASLLIAGFAAVRWASIDASVTTEAHIRDEMQDFRRVAPAELIRVYEDMEKNSLDMPIPYEYHQKVLEKRDWGINAIVAAAIAAFAIIAAVLLAADRRGNPRASADT